MIMSTAASTRNQISAVIQIVLLISSRIKHFGVLEKLFLKNSITQNVVNTSAKLTMYIVFVHRVTFKRQADEFSVKKQL